MISRLPQGFSARCLRFTNAVAAARAGLASGWRAPPLPGGRRTLWVALKGFRSHPSPYPDASWSHVRRRFYELAVGGASPIASEALQRIAALYRNENDIRGRGPNNGATFARPERDHPSPISSRGCARSSASSARRVNSPRRSAMRFALGGPYRFLDDGRIEIDSNTVERSIRPIALNRKNALFAGSDGGGEIGRSSPRWSKPASSTASIPTSISPTRSPRSSTAIPTATSTISCHGPTRKRSRSKPWPEDAAYRRRESWLAANQE